MEPGFNIRCRLPLAKGDDFNLFRAVHKSATVTDNAGGRNDRAGLVISGKAVESRCQVVAPLLWNLVQGVQKQETFAGFEFGG